MRFSSRSSFYLGSIALLLGVASLLHSAPTNVAEQRKQAREQVQKGNFKDGYEVLKTLCHNAESDPEATAEDLRIGVRCLQQLGRLNEADAFLEGTIAAHGKHWLVLRSAAGIYLGQLPKHGFIIAGKFERGDHRGGGEIAHTTERDRVRALQLMWQAVPLAWQDNNKPLVATFFNEFANALLNNRGWQEAWRLQALTDLTQLPDYENGWPSWHAFNGASVDETGKPIFYRTPASWEAAQSDGERWRWLLAQAIENDPPQKYPTLWNFAQFMEQIYGVQSMAQWGYGHLLSGANDEDDTKQNESGTYALHTLREDETIAKLANGIKRLELPDEFNFLKIYRQLADDPAAKNYRELALTQLANVYANRRQYVQAAKCWEENIEKFGPGHHDHKKQQLAQIVGNWGQFENTPVQPAREGARVEYRFRNARQVKFEAQAIKVDLLLADLKAYLKSDPGQLDWQKINIDNIGYRLVHQNETKYLGEQVASWSLDLEPRANHFDRRITITTPLQKGGAYLVTAQLENGNVSKIVLWVADTAIVQKNLDGKTMFYAADAVSGQALPALNLEFFGYRQEHLGNNRWRIFTTNFAELTNNDGITTPDPRDLKNDYNWLITARGAKGRFAHFGFVGVWTGQRHDEEYKAVKVFAITDRPVYRPAQKVFFKMWVRRTQYDQENNSDFAKQSFAVEIHNPQGEKIYSNNLTTDEYAGLTGELALPADAPLGMYQIVLHRQQNNEHIHGQIAFRVEEYKKPEFEVTVQAPTEPVMLGEKITAKISAKYYFGSPVANAKVKYKITRVKHNQNWFPRMPWDWCYEPGYWWFAYDYDWYPGWKQWAGCARPIPAWWGRFSNDPPEVLADVETKISPEGTVEIEIDTALAKELHANFDHSYSITAEVTDESRRVIVGQGNVLVARKPFKVFTWVDRGYYRVGEEVVAHFKAQTLDNQPVVGQGEVQLFKISYEKNAPVETLVQAWPVDTNEEGIAEQIMLASAAGQYRVAYKLTDKKSHTITGGYIFTIIGAGFDGHDFKFNPIELIPEKQEYAPGDKVKLQINVDRPDATVLLFVRPANGIYLPPKVIRMTGKSTIEEIDVVKRDMPNFFVEALTIAGGKVFNDLKEIVVPPEKRILNVEVLPSAKEYKPGEKATVKVRLTDHTGENFVGSTVVTVYDKAVEYISGGSNVPEIKEFFWKWRRHHHPQTPHNLQRWSHHFGLPNKPGMSFLGVFGASVADEAGDDRLAPELRSNRARATGAMLRKGGAMNMLADGAPMAAAAPGAPGNAFFATGKYDKASAEVGGVEGEALLLGGGGGGVPAVVEPTVRTQFADTAFWRATLNTNANGVAEVEFPMPENLSAWKMKVWGLGHGTKVGSSDVEVVTRKNILVRLQAPRFFVQKDEVVLSANVHNYLDHEKEVSVVLDLPGGVLKPQSENNVKVKIPAGGEKRVDWRCHVLQEGEAVVRMKALTDEESDAMEMKFPSYVHGLLKMEAWAGTVRPDREKATISIRVPQERRVDQSMLEIRYSPTLAGAMVDALPYLAEYPYGCTEQTLNRFLPSVITQKTLLQMDVNLAAIREKRTNLNAQEIGDDQARAKQWKRFDRNPVFEEEVLSRMVKEGVKALTEMQCGDGGWGWFSGTHEHSWPHTTAVVVHGLQIAQQNDVPLVPNVLEQGVEWLKRYQAEEIAKIKRGEQETKVHPWKPHADDLDSLVHMILVDAGQENAVMREYLYRDRVQLSVYAKAMFGLALHKTGHAEQLAMILKNIEQFVVEDAENETAYLKMPENTYWWYWYGSEVEANAYYLKLLAHTDAQGSRAPRLVKYLLNNRKHGTYWNSTRDTALCVEAFADFIRLSGEMKPNMVVEVWIDGEKRKEAVIDASNLFTYDNKFVLSGAEVKEGAHEIELRRRGTGPIYFNAYLTNFTLEDHIAKAGLEVKVQRHVYKLQPVEKQVQVEGARGQVVDQKVEKYERLPLENLAKLNSGDLVEVELVIDSKNDYEYLLFEDKKAAGFEAVDVRSGYTGNALGAYVEFRDNRVAFLVRQLARGKHSVSYRLRAEIPGKFSALPAQASAMYAPELKGNSDEIKLIIEDTP